MNEKFAATLLAALDAASGAVLTDLEPVQDSRRRRNKRRCWTA